MRILFYPRTVLKFKHLLSASFAVLCLGLFASCSDSGCIEADDFGEYQTQTLEVKASNSFDSCEYDTTSRLDLRAESHGSGLRACFTTNSATVYDGQGTAHRSSGEGCAKWQPLNEDGTANPDANNEVMGFCVSECLTNCNSRLTGGVVNATPAWKSTDEREGSGSVTLAPGSEISVRATGGITLGGLGHFGDLFLFPGVNSFMPGQKDSTGREVYLTVSRGDVLNIKTQGGFFNSSENIGLRNSRESGPLTSAESERVARAFDRVAIYLERPPLGYLNSSGFFGDTDHSGPVPFYADYSMYDCAYSSSTSTCSGVLCPPVCEVNSARVRSVYSGITATNDEINSAFNLNFPINSTSSVHGGLLFPSQVALTTFKSLDFEPAMFNNTPGGLCASGYDCPSRGIEDGRMVGDLSSAVSFALPNSSQVTFKYLHPSCRANINVKIRAGSATGTAIFYDHPNLAISQTAWSSGGEHVGGESGQFVQIQRVGPPETFTTATGDVVDCGRSLAMKYTRYFNLQVNKSGMVSFANMNEDSTASGDCSIKFRIINPSGSHQNITIPTEVATRYRIPSSITEIPADFFEYGNFNNSSTEEERSAISALNIRNVNSSFASNLGKKIFVRKGQMIRFAPQSWNGSWSPKTGTTRRCGVGMVYRVEHRPALICSGSGTVSVPNPNCTQIRNSDGAIRGCEARTDACSQGSVTSSTSSSGVTSTTTPAAFCPGAFNTSSPCIGDISYTEPLDSVSPRTAPVVTRQTFAASSGTVPACLTVYNPTYDSSGTVNGYNLDPTKVAKCERCQDLMSAAGLQLPLVDRVNADFCYNLENYTGSLRNLTVSGLSLYSIIDDSSNLDSDPIHSTITKGAQILSRFNNTLGNLGSFAPSTEDYYVAGDLDYGFGLNARVSLLYLDASSFRVQDIMTSYGNNSSTAPYSITNKNNGFKLKLSDYLNFSNGENLEVVFCKESSGTSNNCRSLSRPTRISNVSDIVNYNHGPTNSFAFDSFGNLYRNSNPRAGKANCDGVTTGDKYFCHCRGNFDVSGVETCSANSGDDDSSPCENYENCRYRLSFRIKDPEVNDCYTPRSTNDPSTSYNEMISLACGGAGQPACDGIKNSNNDYQAGSSNDDQICSHNDFYADTGTPPVRTFSRSNCAKQYVCSSKYTNNTGQYNVLIRVKNKNIEISGLVSSIVDPVLTALDGRGVPGASNYQVGQVERVYNLIISDPYYKLVLKMSLVLMITFYGLTYLMGLTEGGTSEIITKVLKISLVLFFVSDQGWYWFNTLIVRTFKDGTNQISFMMATAFDNSPQLRAALESGDYSDKSVLFSSVDKVLGLFFNKAVQKKISALLFSGLFGWLYILIIYYALIAYIFAVSTAVLVFLTAQVFISILFILGPIFFIFTLFNQTKEMFDKWLQNLIGFSLQQIFLLITLSFFNMMMYEIIRNALGYRVCWDEVWTINIIIRISLLSFWTIPNVPPLFDSQAEMGSSGRGEGIPSFFSILFIWIVAKLMKEFIEFMSNVAADIGGGIKATDLGSGIAASTRGARQFVSKKVTKPLYHKTVGRGTQYLDKKLFDSGKLADRERKAKMHQDKMDIKNKKAMVKAGEAKVNEYKKNFGANLAKMSKEQQREELNKIRDEAMNDKGKELGLKDEEIQRLKSEKGTKYRGDNLAGYVAARTRQKFKKGGAVSKSITEDDVSRDFSKKQAKKALKRADEQGREEMMKAVEKGDVYVRAGRFRKRMTGEAKMPRIGESKDYKNAREQLEREGKIKTIGGGSIVRSIALKDEEKKMIRERMRENQVKDEEGKISRTSRISTIASLQKTVDTENAIDSGDVSSDLVRKSKNPFRRGELVAKTFTSGKAQRKQDLKDKRLKTIAEKLQEKHNSLGDTIGSYDAQITEISENIKRIESDEKFKDINEYGELEQLRQSGNMNDDQRAKMQQLERKVNRTEYQELRNQRDAEIGKRAEVINQKNAAEERRLSLNTEMGNVTSLREVQENTQSLINDYEKGATVTNSEGQTVPKYDKKQYKKAKEVNSKIANLQRKVMGKDASKSDITRSTRKSIANIVRDSEFKGSNFSKLAAQDHAPADEGVLPSAPAAPGSSDDSEA